MRKLTALLLALTCNCPSVPRKDPHAPPGYVEPALAHYVDAFFADCASACPPRDSLRLSVQGVWGPMVYQGSTIMGLALLSFSLYGVRRVVYVRMDERGPWTVRATVYHELMHAVLFAQHVNRAYPEIPAWSLIDEYDAGDEAFYRENWNSLARTDFCRLTDQYKGKPCSVP